MSRLHHPDYNTWTVQIMEFLTMEHSTLPVLISLGAKIRLRILFSAIIYYFIFQIVLLFLCHFCFIYFCYSPVTPEKFVSGRYNSISGIIEHVGQGFHTSRVYIIWKCCGNIQKRVWYLSLSLLHQCFVFNEQSNMAAASLGFCLKQNPCSLSTHTQSM